MKRIILTFLFLLVSFTSLSQIITVSVSEIKSYACPGKVDAYFTIANQQWSANQSVNTKYIIDLNKKTCKFYRDGIFVSKTNFVNVTKKGDTYSITLLDNNLNPPYDQFYTYIIVNPKENLFLYYWYDDAWDFTKVETLLVSNLKVTP